MILDVSEVVAGEVEGTDSASSPDVRKPRSNRSKNIGKQRARRTGARSTRKAAANGRALNSSLQLALPSAAEGTIDTSSTSTKRGIWNIFLRYFRNMRAPQKRLRVCESVSLGDKRFLAIVRVDAESFLLGGSTGSVSMLAKLNEPGSFSAVLQNKAVEAGSLQ
jgi:flagellar biosynthesis protein FliO